MIYFFTKQNINYTEGKMYLVGCLQKATIQVRDEEGFKDIAVSKLISSHDAVRTFITISAEKGVPVPSIAKITGKTVTVLLKNYLVDSQRVAEREIMEKWSSPKYSEPHV